LVCFLKSKKRIATAKDKNKINGIQLLERKSVTSNPGIRNIAAKWNLP